MTKPLKPAPKRPYDLGKRLEQMDWSRAAILRAARSQLAAKGFQRLTMETLAAESGVTRQTIHNLFGTKSGVLEALFDVLALDGGMDRMREVMTEPSADALLEKFIATFCGFWSKDRVLFRRIHGIGAIDPDFGAVLEARNQRRAMAATHVVGRVCGTVSDASRRIALLTALTSFEFFDALAEVSGNETEAAAGVLALARSALQIGAVVSLDRGGQSSSRQPDPASTAP